MCQSHASIYPSSPYPSVTISLFFSSVTVCFVDKFFCSLFKDSTHCLGLTYFTLSSFKSMYYSSDPQILLARCLPPKNF